MTSATDLATTIAVVGALLLLGSGVAKLVRPEHAVASMREIGWVSTAALVRVGALAELGTGFAVLAFSGWLPKALLLVVYLAFATFCIASMRGRSGTPCGCFGEGGSFISGRHLTINLLIGAAAAGTLAAGTNSLTTSVHVATRSGVVALVVCAATSLLAATALSRPTGSR
jgi:hypothetical protein